MDKQPLLNVSGQIHLHKCLQPEATDEQKKYEQHYCACFLKEK